MNRSEVTATLALYDWRGYQVGVYLALRKPGGNPLLWSPNTLRVFRGVMTSTAVESDIESWNDQAFWGLANAAAAEGL